MNKLKVAAFAMLAMFVFTGCSFNKNNEELIKINDTVINQKEFDKAYEMVTSNNMFAQMGIDLKSDPDNIFALMMREKVVSELIVKTLLTEEMEKRNITATKEELEASEKEIINRFGSKEQLTQILKTNSVSYDQFKKDLEDEIKLKKFVDSIAMVSIGDKEAKKYYDANIDKFKFPKRVRASHILISANPEQIKLKLMEENKDFAEEALTEQINAQMKKAKDKAEELKAQVKKAPTTFAKVAKENSEDSATAVRGGDLGFFGKDEMVEPFANAAFSMKPNTISDVIQTQYGYHIIMVTDRAEAGQLSFEESKKDIIAYLEGQDKVDILKNKIEELRKAAKIEYVNDDYNPENIQKKIKEAAAESPELDAFNPQAPVADKK